MSSEIRFIVDKLNAEPFRMGLSLVRRACSEGVCGGGRGRTAAAVGARERRVRGDVPVRYVN